MLLKSHSTRFLEDFGLELNRDTLSRDKLSYFKKAYKLQPDEEYLYLYEDCGISKVSSIESSPVVRINVLWMDKDIKLKCGVASTIKQKKQGLQGKTLNSGEGLFFPYAGLTDVVFHQGSVDYPLDIMFVRGNKIIQIEADTEVGGSERWKCAACDSVIETKGSFCFENDVNVGDEVVYFSVSAQDEVDLQKEREEELSMLTLAADLI